MEILANDAGDPPVSAAVAGVPLPPVHERISFAIHQLSAQLARICNPLFSRYGVDLISCRILVLALERDGIGIGEVVSLLIMPQSTISHQIQRLERLGYVYRQRGEADQRMVAVMLTPTGRLVAEACNRMSVEIYQSMVEGMAPETIDFMRCEMNQMLARLDRIKPTGRP